MSKPIPVACPKCGGPVHVAPSAGGRGTNDLTSYSADCDRCGMLVDHLSDTGRKDSAIRDYNRWARDYVTPVATTNSITVQSGYTAFRGGLTSSHPSSNAADNVNASAISAAPELLFDRAFVADIAADVQYADALERHVTGKSSVRRATAIQTLQAIAGLPMNDLSSLLVWAKSQRF